MSADEFWKDDPQLFVSYRTSFINKKKREREEMEKKKREQEEMERKKRQEERERKKEKREEEKRTEAKETKAKETAKAEERKETEGSRQYTATSESSGNGDCSHGRFAFWTDIAWYTYYGIPVRYQSGKTMFRTGQLCGRL